MDDSTGIEITTRPFLEDLFSTSASPGTETATSSAASRENSHLLAAVTGQPNHSVSVTRTTRRNHHESGTEHLPMASTPVEGFLTVDWALVETLTKELAVDEANATRSRSSFDVATASIGPETEHETAMLAQIDDIIERRSVRDTSRDGYEAVWGALKKAHYRQAIFDQAFRYGRLQQYLREPDVEDISVVGHDNVVVTKTNGLTEKRPPIASSDEELERMIADIATYRGRTFTRPGGDLDLDIGGARLSATGVGPTSVTNLTVRKHNLVGVDLDDMVRNGTISAGIREFLSAAARANLCVMVAGYPGDGKTTMLRALMSTVPPDEKIVTIETERELYLNKLPERHWQVMDLQYVPPQFSGTDSTGGFTLAQCLSKALRASAKRILFAEIKDIEGPIALQTMKVGKGSMSTIHARSAADAIDRFADVLMNEQGLSDDTVPLRQIGRSLDLILYISGIEQPDGTRRRVVTEVAEVQANDSGEKPIAAQLFRFDPERNDYSRPEQRPSKQLEDRLALVGYDHARAQGDV